MISWRSAVTQDGLNNFGQPAIFTLFSGSNINILCFLFKIKYLVVSAFFKSHIIKS